MKLLAVLAAVVTLAAIGVTAAVSSGDGRAVVKFDTMAPVVPPYTGTTNPIRGVNGGGVPWKLESAHGGFVPTDASTSRWRDSSSSRQARTPRRLSGES
jgi:hypothetical protein